MSGKILISGAGIAGCCVAWWLERYGYAVTVVEQAPEPRRGGYVLDFWGLGYDVAEKMGLLDELRRHDLDVRQFSIVGDHGRRITGINQEALKDLTGGHIMSLPRSAVASTLYQAVKDGVDIRFGDCVTGLTEGPHGVDVRFRGAEPASFDLVIGADGLHSAVRSITFGEQHSFERFLGYYVAAFTTKGYPHRDPHAYIAYGEPGRQIWRITMGEDITVFLLVFAEAEPLSIPAHDPGRPKQILAGRYSGSGWEADEMLRALETTTDLYFDRVSQIVMPWWTKGRVALIGDACACPSLLAGEGSAMAMAEAYTLAGELDAARGEHAGAFQAYEQKLRPYVKRKQKAARGFAASFVPKSALGLWARNVSISVMSGLGLTRLLFKAQLSNRLQLGSYR